MRAHHDAVALSIDGMAGVARWRTGLNLLLGHRSTLRPGGGTAGAVRLARPSAVCVCASMIRSWCADGERRGGMPPTRWWSWINGESEALPIGSQVNSSRTGQTRRAPGWGWGQVIWILAANLAYYATI